MEVIKTNLSISYGSNEILDHQSYIENEKSWELFVEKIKSGQVFSNRSTVKVENIVYDDFHLSCDVVNFTDFITKHLAYKPLSEEQ